MGVKRKRKKNVHNVNKTVNKKSSFVNNSNCKCIYTNADQYMNKRNEMNILVEEEQPDIIGITEVKPKQSRYKISESEIAIKGYELFHNLGDEGRGVALLVKEEMNPTPNDCLNSQFSENVFVDVTQGDGTALTVGLIYRSPSSTEENNDRLCSLIRQTADKTKTNLLMVGDFNLPSIDWENETCKNNETHVSSRFLQAYTEANLYQHQQEITRYREGETPKILDLVLTNREDMIKEIKTEAGLGKSDHLTLTITLNAPAPNKTLPARPCFSKTDNDKLKKSLESVEWESELKCKNSNGMWKTIKSKLDEAIKTSTPMTRARGRRKKPWMDGGTLTSVRKKYRLFRRWLNTRNGEDYLEYIKARNKARKDCRKAQRNLEKKLAKEAKTNPNGVWKYTKSKTSCRSGIPDLDKGDGTKTKSDSEKAEVLNDFFKSVFTTEDSSSFPKLDDYNFNEELKDIEIKEEEIQQMLEKLQPRKAPGPDGIPPGILSAAAKQLARPLATLFRQTLDEGKLPDEWKKALVSPIYKRKGSKTSPNNYRPVSLTCIVCKIMEKIVRKAVMAHLQENEIVTSEQHGFISGRSCMTQLLEAMDTWTEVLDDHGSVDIIYTDFQKAFDSVPHGRLMEKVSACGIKGKAQKWIDNFLRDRSQRVVVNGATSQEGAVTSGIPQGSVLGPILFVIYINDLPQTVKSQIKMFADDTKLFSRTDKVGATDLQNDLDALTQWSDRWQLKFHPEKCGVLKLGQDRGTAYYMDTKDKDGNTTRIRLKETQEEKDLGVTIDKALSFKQHIEEATLKANRVVGNIRRSFDYLSLETFTLLFKSLVRPILEYGHCVWNPDEEKQKGLCAKLENVQKRATKLLGEIKDLSYPERLRKLRLPSLEHRRKRGDAIEVYKYLHGKYNVQSPTLELNKDAITRGNSMKLEKKRPRLNIRGNYFSNRVVNLWNGLPEKVVTAPSVDAFKARLDRHWENLPSVYNPMCLN